MLKRSHVRQFLAVVDSGSFTSAAARVRITQPTLSVGIAEMEKTVGAKLFIRDRKHIRLTEAGARLLPIARQLEQGFRAAEGLNTPSHEGSQRLRLGVLRTLSPAMVARAVAVFRARELELIEGSGHELRTALSGGRIDAAFTILRSDDVAHHSQPLFTEPYVMLAAKGHHLAGTVVSPESLAGEVMIARRACERLQDTSRFFTQAGVRPRFALRSDNDALCLEMVEAGLGITTAPRSLQTPDMSQIGIAGYDFERTVGIIQHNQYALDNASLEQLRIELNGLSERP